MTHELLLLPGDGIGPEVINEVEKIISVLTEEFDFKAQVTKLDIGGAAYEKYGDPLPDTVLTAAKNSSAILLGGSRGSSVGVAGSAFTTRSGVA